jgi:hypothetical protein
MTMTGTELEQLFHLTLEQAQRLIDDGHDDLVDQASAIMDARQGDRLLVELLDIADQSPSDTLKRTALGEQPETMITLLHDVAVRLSDALDQMQKAIAEDHRLQGAHYIVEQARAEGRIP